MSEINDLISQIPMSEVAAQLGVDEQTAQQAVEAAAPALVQGMDANAQDPAGARSLASALDGHVGGPGIASLADVDQQDGAKIVRNVFGSNEQDVVNRLSGAQPALGGDLIAKLLPILAPIVLKWLASKWTQRGGSAGPSGTGSGGGTGEAPRNFPTRKDAPAQPQPEPKQAPEQDSGFGGGLGDLLGQVLGGSKSSGGLGGGLGDLLGGLLGNGKR